MNRRARTSRSYVSAFGNPGLHVACCSCVSICLDSCLQDFLLGPSAFGTKVFIRELWLFELRVIYWNIMLYLIERDCDVVTRTCLTRGKRQLYPIHFSIILEINLGRRRFALLSLQNGVQSNKESRLCIE